MSGLQFQGYIEKEDGTEVILECHCDYEIARGSVYVELTEAVLFGWNVFSLLGDDERAQLEQLGLEAWEAESDRQAALAEDAADSKYQAMKEERGF